MTPQIHTSYSGQFKSISLIQQRNCPRNEPLWKAHEEPALRHIYFMNCKKPYWIAKNMLSRVQCYWNDAHLIREAIFLLSPLSLDVFQRPLLFSLSFRLFVFATKYWEVRDWHRGGSVLFHLADNDCQEFCFEEIGSSGLHSFHGNWLLNQLWQRSDQQHPRVQQTAIGRHHLHTSEMHVQTSSLFCRPGCIEKYWH